MFLDSCFLTEIEFKSLIENEKFPWKNWPSAKKDHHCPLCKKKRESGVSWWILHLAFCHVAKKEFKTSKRVINRPDSQPICDEEMLSQPLPDIDVEMRSESSSKSSNGSAEVMDLAEHFQQSCSTSTYVPTNSSVSTCDSEKIKAQKEDMKRERDLEKLREIEIKDDVAQTDHFLDEISKNYNDNELLSFWEAISIMAEKKIKNKFSPRSFLTEAFVEFWHAPYACDKNEKMYALASILPVEFSMDISASQIREIINYFNLISSSIRNPDNPRHLTPKHINDALQHRLALENGEMETVAKQLPMIKKLKEGDIKDVLNYLEKNTDPQPETRHFCKKLSTIENQLMLDIVKTKEFQEKFYVKIGMTGNETYYSAPRRLAQLKFKFLIEEFNARRNETSQISEYLFRKIVPDFIEEPNKIDQFSCICQFCYNLKSLGDKICSCLYDNKFTKTKWSYEALFDEIFKIRGCVNHHWDLGSQGKVVPVLCSKFLCKCQPANSKMTVLQLMCKKWNRLEEFLRDEASEEQKIRVTIFSESGDGTERATFSLPELFKRFATDFKEYIPHYQSTKLTSCLTSQLRKQEIDTTDEIVIEVDFRSGSAILFRIIGGNNRKPNKFLKPC